MEKNSGKYRKRVTRVLPCLIALALGAGSAMAATGLSDTQMERVTAGGVGGVPSCGGIGCSSLTVTVTSTVTTVPVNGQLTTQSSNTPGGGCQGACTTTAPPSVTNQTTNNGTTAPGSAFYSVQTAPIVTSGLPPVVISGTILSGTGM